MWARYELYLVGSKSYQHLAVALLIMQNHIIFDHVNSLVQDCGTSSADTLEIPQSCTIYHTESLGYNAAHEWHHNGLNKKYTNLLHSLIKVRTESIHEQQYYAKKYFTEAYHIGKLSQCLFNNQYGLTKNTV